jgi:hypothetical protein
VNTFAGNVLTKSSLVVPPPADSAAPNIRLGAADPTRIVRDSFLSSALPDGVEQVIVNGVETITLPSLNEYVTGQSMVTVNGDAYTLVEQVTTSTVWGGYTGTFGSALPAVQNPFDDFANSTLHEGPVTSMQNAPAHDQTTRRSDSIEMGDRVVTRTDWEVKTVNGTQSDSVYGDKYSHTWGLGNEDITVGKRYDNYDQVLNVEGVALLNLLIGIGLHFQCRPGAELNFNLWNVVIALSESMVGLVNLDCIVGRIAGKEVNFGLSGARLAADVTNVRFCGLPVGPVRIPS